MLITPLTPGLNPVTHCTMCTISIFVQNTHHIGKSVHFVRWAQKLSLWNYASILYNIFNTPTKLGLKVKPSHTICTMSPSHIYMFMRTLIIAIVRSILLLRQVSSMDIFGVANFANVTLQLVPLGFCYRQ